MSTETIVAQSRQDDVLILTIQNPPVNAFSPGEIGRAHV